MIKNIIRLLLVSILCVSCRTSTNIEPSTIKVFISGAVQTPGEYQLNQGDKLIDLLISAGGINYCGSGLVRVSHYDEAYKKIYRYNVYDILSGKSSDLMLKDQDRVIVPNASGFGKYDVKHQDSLRELQEYKRKIEPEH